MIIWLRNVVKIIFFISFYLSTYGHSAEKQDIANLLKHQKSISSINIDHFDDIEQLHVPLNDYESYCSNKKNSLICKQLSKIVPFYSISINELNNLNFESSDPRGLYNFICGEKSSEDKISKICQEIDKRSRAFETAENFDKLYLHNKI